MHTNPLLSLAGALVALVLSFGTAVAQNAPPPVNFKPGTYSGTLVVTSTAEGFSNKTVLKLHGHTKDATTITCLAPPDLSHSIYSSSNSNTSVTAFTLEYDAGFGVMLFTESNGGAEGFQSLHATGSSFTGKLSLETIQAQYGSGSFAVSQTAVVTLTRTGP